MADFKNFIAEFSQRYSLENLVADDKDAYTLTFDDDIEVRCFEKFGLVCFISVLDALPEEETQAWLKRLLNYTFMRMKHSGIAATLDEDDRVLLHTRFELDGLKVYEFEEKLERYLNVFEEYRYFLSQASSPSSLSSREVIFKP